MISKFLPPTQTVPKFNPNPAPEVAPAQARPKQSEDMGDADVYRALYMGDTPAHFIVFSTPLSADRRIEILKDGAYNGPTPETQGLGDTIVIVRNAPIPPVRRAAATVETVVTCDSFGVLRQHKRTIPGDILPPEPEPTLTVVIAHNLYPFGFLLAVLQNREWARFIFGWGSWNLSARGILEDHETFKDTLEDALRVNEQKG